MKKTLFLMTLAFLMSCGKSPNQVSSAPSETSGNNTIETTAVSFEGVYDLREANSQDCGASIRIVKECNGYKLLSNNLGPEEFCNVNKGEFRGDNGTDRNPPPPDRNPPPPDRNPPPPDRVDPTRPRGEAPLMVVTQNGNELKSVVRVSDRVSYSNTLTLRNELLTKVSQLKSRNVRCVFEKR
jgi:hypothetical protein